MVLSIPRGHCTEVSAEINVWRIASRYGRDIKGALCSYGVELVEGHTMPDHVHMLLGIPPKFSVANIIGKLKGKSTILINQKYVRQRNFRGLSFWRKYGGAE